MKLTVYLGANEGNDPAFREAVRELGHWIGESGNGLVYGGSKSGLMGELARSVLEAGGTAIGVEPQFFIDAKVQYEGLTRLIVTRDMAERKAKMIELGDAFLAFPGGTGTLEEISEVMSRVAMGQLKAPCILYDLNGYYSGLKVLLRHMVETGLSDQSRLSGIHLQRISLRSAPFSKCPECFCFQVKSSGPFKTRCFSFSAGDADTYRKQKK